ncbi:ArsR/SmtB family transcription factor [Halegenticoccus tardaugens]|uniref:ArsR/SmtB family transcription factor n=1 Tax=Halegenticoccus tardaugens TaxID=2071624 RepID=UPI00100A741C|nr:winged helix-turn-helix domain-containing protein [Halegenticoccus tardaugens]
MSKPRFTRQIPNARSKIRPPQTQDVDGDEVVSVARALGSDTRWQIVRALARDTRTIQELTEAVGRSKGTVSTHVKQLENAGVAASRFNVSDSGGVEKEVALAVDEVTLKLSNR